MPGFKELGVSELLCTLLQGQGIVKPTPVQEEAIPPLVQGLDVIAKAKTGTGKTLAFLLPIMDKIHTERAYPQALIMAPTRELALQITEEARKLARHTDIKILAVYGGQDVEKQLRKLEGGRHLIIGTPGRLLDHMRRETLDLSGVKMLVLDEADQMLHMGFLEDVETIITAVPYRRQTMLFSATMPDPVKRLAANYMKEPLDIIIKSGSPIPLDNIKQQVVECSDRNKEEALKALIERDRPYLAIIFCRTKRRVSKLNEALQAAGYDCDELHGDLSQGKREGVMKRFRDAKLQLLVATDVAARGLDVEGITHIFNYDMPLDVDSYIHRIGRTGRAGGKGLAITFASPREQDGLDLIEHGISQRLDRRRYDKDEFGVGEFITVQGGARHGGRHSGGAEGARTGRGPKTGSGRGGAPRGEGRAPRSEGGASRGEGRSPRGEGRTPRSEGRTPRSEGGASRGEGRAPRGEGGARQGGRGRGKEAGGWGAPAEQNRRGRSDATAGKRGGQGADAPKGASKAAGVVRVGGGYGAFASRGDGASSGNEAASSAGSSRGANRTGGPSTGYSENVTRGADGGAYAGGIPRGGLGSGYGTGPSRGGGKGGKGSKGGYSGAKGGAGKGGRNSGSGGPSRGGRGSSGGFKSGGRGTSR